MKRRAWRCDAPPAEKDAWAERCGTTPSEARERSDMLARASVLEVQTELEPWSRPEMSWKIRQDRDVAGNEGTA